MNSQEYNSDVDNILIEMQSFYVQTNQGEQESMP